MFYDMGAGSVQVAIAEFNTKIDKKTKLPRRYFDILSKAWDENLGGAYLSQNLAEKFADDFISQHNRDPRGNLKAEYRLRSLGEKMKEFGGISSITLCGLCTDICVISNALLIKAFCPELPVSVDASCCAGVSPESHENALKAMEMCQIDVVRKE